MISYADLICCLPLVDLVLIMHKTTTWKWLDFHENECTVHIHLVLHKESFAVEAKIHLEMTYSSMSWHRKPDDFNADMK